MRGAETGNVGRPLPYRRGGGAGDGDGLEGHTCAGEGDQAADHPTQHAAGRGQRDDSGEDDESRGVGAGGDLMTGGVRGKGRSGGGGSDEVDPDPPSGEEVHSAEQQADEDGDDEGPP